MSKRFSPTGSTLAAAALSEFVGLDGCEVRFPVPQRLRAEDDAALEEHLAEVLQREAVT
jgi:hypothetical protein